MRATLRPGFRDWLLLALSLAFTLVGGWLLLVGKGGDGIVAATLFFGVCLAAAIKLIADKLRAGDPTAGRELLARLQAGEALAPSRGRKLVAAGALCGLGLALLATGRALGPEFMAISGALAIGGAGLLTAILLGWRADQAVRLAREGLVFTTPATRYTAPWSAFVAAELGEMHGNPVVRMRIGDLDAVVATLVARRGRREVHAARLRRSMDWSMRLTGCHVMFMPSALGVDPVALFEALHRYLGDAALRAELPAASAAGVTAG